MEETAGKSLGKNAPFGLSTKAVDKFVGKLGESPSKLRPARLFVTMP
jgi:hypothetical protein